MTLNYNTDLRNSRRSLIHMLSGHDAPVPVASPIRESTKSQVNYYGFQPFCHRRHWWKITALLADTLLLHAKNANGKPQVNTEIEPPDPWRHSIVTGKQRRTCCRLTICAASAGSLCKSWRSNFRVPLPVCDTNPRR